MAKSSSCSPPWVSSVIGISELVSVSKLPWVRLPEGAPAFEGYYDSKTLWPAASLERVKALFG